MPFAFQCICFQHLRHPTLYGRTDSSISGAHGSYSWLATSWKTVSAGCCCSKSLATLQTKSFNGTLSYFGGYERGSSPTNRFHVCRIPLLFDVQCSTFNPPIIATQNGRSRNIIIIVYGCLLPYIVVATLTQHPFTIR